MTKSCSCQSSRAPPNTCCSTASSLWLVVGIGKCLQDILSEAFFFSLWQNVKAKMCDVALTVLFFSSQLSSVRVERRVTHFYHFHSSESFVALVFCFFFVLHVVLGVWTSLSSRCFAVIVWSSKNKIDNSKLSLISPTYVPLRLSLPLLLPPPLSLSIYLSIYLSALSPPPSYLSLLCLNCLTDECVSDHSERIRSIQIDKNFITQTFRIYNFIISRTVRN